MTFKIEFSENLHQILKKLKKKDHPLFIMIKKKTKQLANCNEISIEHYKNLKHDMSHLKRVQIGSFVLTFTVKGNTIIFEDFDHHDIIYRKS